MAAVGAAAVGAGKALVDMTVGASQYADDILTMSTVTGMSTDNLQAYKYAAELVDVSMETLTGSMSKQVKSMSDARDGSAEFADAYSKLGISVADSNGELRDSDTVYWETIDALGNVANETERDALAMQIFGKSAQELNPLIAQGSKGIAELTEEAKQMGAIMSGDSLKALGAFDDSVQRLKSGAGAAKNILGMVLLPQLQILADDGVSLIGDFTKGLSEAGGDWNKISDVIGNTVGGLTNMLMESLPKFIQVGLDIVTSIGGAIVNNLPVIIDSAVIIIMTLLQAIIDGLPQMTEGALQLVLALVDGIIANLPQLVEGALLMIVALAAGIGDALPELIPAIIQAVILIVETLINNMDKILEAAFKIIEGLAKGLLDALPKLIEALPRIITSIVDFITNNLPQIINMGIQLTVQLAAGLIKALPQLVLSLPQIVTAIISGIGKATTSIVDIGKNIVIGLWNGIASMIGWIEEKISGFVGGIVSNVKGVLGIQSPSTVFACIGGYMSEGLGVGFVEAMDGVKRDMKQSIPTNFDIDTNFNNTAGVGLNSNTANTFNIANMIVRSDSDIKNIARELYLLQRRSDRGYALS
jgi:phage-related protein